MSYASEVAADTPIGYWRLGEPSGTTAADSSGNALNGTYTNTPTLAQTGAISDGDTAVSFASASSEYVTVPDNALLDLGDVWTIEAWVKRASISTVQGIASKGTGGYYLRFNSNNKIQLLKSFTSSLVESTSTVTDTTTWHHVVGTKNGATVKIYLDGVDVTGTVTNATTVNNTIVFTIGRDGTNTEYFNGAIDEVAVYATALSATRVTAHFDAATSADVTVVASAAVAVGSSPPPVVLAARTATAGLALGITGAPVVLIARVPTAAIAAGSPASPVAGVARLAAAALSLGVTTTPTVLVTKLPTASLALGATTAPVVLIVVPVSASLATGSTPAPTVITGSGSTVVVPAALALGSAPAPSILITKTVIAALALGSTPAPPGLISKTASAALALGSTPTPNILILKSVTAALGLGSAPTPTRTILRAVTAALATASTPTATTSTSGGAATVKATLTVQDVIGNTIIVGDTVRPEVALEDSAAADVGILTLAH